MSPDKKKLLDTFESVTCPEPGTREQITAYFHAFTTAFQDLRRHRLDKQFSEASQAQMFYKKLPKLFKHHMALRDPMRKDSELRENLLELQQEVRDVMDWTVYKDAVSAATHGRAMGAMGVLVSDSDKRPKRIEPREGEVVKFTTSVTPQSTTWLDQNAGKFHCRHSVVGSRFGNGKPSHIIVGPADKIGAIFNNKDARAAGLTERVKKVRVAVNDAGAASDRDSTKPIVSHVAAQAVQTNITSPSAPLISDHNAQGQEDQKPEAESTVTPAKNTSQMYTYTSSTMPSSNAYHGARARVT